MLRATDRLAVAAAAAVAVTAALGGAFSPGQALAVGLIFAAILGCSAAVHWRRVPTADELLVLAVVASGMLSAAVAGYAPLAAKQTLAGWFIAWCVWFTARRSPPRGAALISVVLVAAALVVTGGVVLEAMWSREIRVGGLFESPNVAAALLVVTVPLLGSRNSGRFRRWRVFAGSLIVAGVVLTGSRAGLLALLVGAAVLLPKGRVRSVGLLVGATLVTAVLALRFVTHPEILAWFRPAIWRGVLRLWMAHPVFGVGPGGLPDAAGSVRLLHADHIGQHPFLITYAESSPLGLLVQCGLVGVVLTAAAVICWWLRSRRDGAWSDRFFRAAIAAMVVVAAFHDVLTVGVVLWWWAAVVGTLEAITRADHDVWDSQTVDTAMARIVRGSIFAFVVLWAVVQPAWARWIWHCKAPAVEVINTASAAEPWFDAPLEWRVRAILDEDTMSWELAGEGLTRARQAVSVHPGASRLWLLLGQLQFRIYNELGRWPSSVEEARTAFARAAELEPHQPWPWLEWARLERGLGNLDRAVELTRRAVAEEPNAVRALLFLARLELDLGSIEPAREAYATAVAAAGLRRRTGLSAYERELLAAPSWQFREIAEALP